MRSVVGVGRSMQIGYCRRIAAVHCPLLVMHGREDEVIGFYHGVALYEMANEPKRYLWVDGAGHNDFNVVAHPRYLLAIKEFAGSLGQRP